MFQIFGNLDIWYHLSRCNNVIPSENYLPAILSLCVSALILNAGFVVFEWKNHILLMDARFSQIKPSSHFKLLIQTEAVWKVTFTFYCKHSLIEIDWPESRSECAHVPQLSYISLFSRWWKYMEINDQCRSPSMKEKDYLAGLGTLSKTF